MAFWKIACPTSKRNNVLSLIKNDEFHKLNMPINFKLAYELYKNKNVLIDKDIFNYKKVCESLWKYV